MANALMNRLCRLRDDEEGSITIEAMLWLPFFFAVMVVITDTSLAFYGRAQAFRILQDGNRAYSMGDLADDDAAESYIRTQLASLSPNATVTTELDFNTGIISSEATIPVDDLLAFGSIDAISSIDMTVTSQHYKEF